MTFYNHIESVRGLAIDLTNGRKWRGASDKAAVFDALDAARREYMRLSDENAKLRELATYALRHIIEFECEEPDLKMFRGKPCEDCADCGSSDCPKCMPRMFDVS